MYALWVRTTESSANGDQQDYCWGMPHVGENVRAIAGFMGIIHDQASASDHGLVTLPCH